MISNAIFNGFVTYVTNPYQTRFITNYNVSHYQILERNIYIPSMFSMILNVIIFWKICQLAMSKHKTLYFYYIFVQKYELPSPCSYQMRWFIQKLFQHILHQKNIDRKLPFYFIYFIKAKYKQLLILVWEISLNYQRTSSLTDMWKVLNNLYNV